MRCMNYLTRGCCIKPLISKHGDLKTAGAGKLLKLTTCGCAWIYKSQGWIGTVFSVHLLLQLPSNVVCVHVGFMNHRTAFLRWLKGTLSPFFIGRKAVWIESNPPSLLIHTNLLVKQNYTVFEQVIFFRLRRHWNTLTSRCKGLQCF